MPDKKYSWYKIAEHVNELRFSENNIAIAHLQDKKICIGVFKEKLFAFAYKCPHAGGIMAEGFIDAVGNVVCPVHRYRFDLKNGRNSSGEGYFLKNWLVEQREEGVFVRVEETSGFWSFFH